MGILDSIRKATAKELAELLMGMVDSIPEETQQKFCDKIATRKFLDDSPAIQAAADRHSVSLPNGTKGKEYNAEIPLPTELEGYFVTDATIEGLDALGLTCTYDQEASCVRMEGTPAKADTCYLQLAITVDPQVKGNRPDSTFRKEVRLVLNADPRDLWQDIPVPKDTPYYKANVDTAFIPAGEGMEKAVMAASIRGRSHAHQGTCRDDHFTIKYNPATGWYVIVVADGAGSAVYSRQGSKIACEVTSSTCEAWLKENEGKLLAAIDAYRATRETTEARALREQLYYMFGGAVYTAYNAIEAEAAQTKDKKTIREFATTLLLSLVKKVDDEWFICSFWIGDGAIGIYRKPAPAEEPAAEEAPAPAEEPVAEEAPAEAPVEEEACQVACYEETCVSVDGGSAIVEESVSIIVTEPEPGTEEPPAAPEEAPARAETGTGSVTIMGQPDGGDFAGQTCFLTMPSISKDATSILKRVKFSLEKDFTGLVLMTDGVSDPKFETDDNLANATLWDALWTELEEAVPALQDHGAEPGDTLAEWLNFWAKGNHDDRTIAILY